MSILRCERGGSTAEFAIVLPVILVVVGIVVGALMLASIRVALVSGAHDIARLEARGDSALVSQRITTLPKGSSIEREHRGDLLCVNVSAAPGKGVLAALTVSGQGCALKTEQN